MSDGVLGDETPTEAWERYRWAGEEEAFCFTLVQGLTVREVVEAFAPQRERQVGYDVLAELGFEEYDSTNGPHYCAGGVAALADGWLLVVEINGYGATLPETHEVLARGGYAMTMYTNVNTVTSVYGTSGRKVEQRFVERQYAGRYICVEHLEVDAPTPALAAAQVPGAIAAAGLLGSDDTRSDETGEFVPTSVNCMVFGELVTGVTLAEQDVRGATFDVIRIPV